MKRIITFLLFGLTLLALPVLAQDVDRDYVFIDNNENVLDDGATVLCNVVEVNDFGVELINSGVSFMNRGGASDDYFIAYYVIERIDNGAYQICFPSTCNTRNEVGSYATARGMLMNSVQDLQSEWFPEDDGECIVSLSIEVFTKEAGFPPTYTHKAWGPSITLRFVKGGDPVPEPINGDVNDDGEVNILDVDAIIAMILSGIHQDNGDVNKDNEVNIMDVDAVIAIILKS